MDRVGPCQSLNRECVGEQQHQSGLRSQVPGTEGELGLHSRSSGARCWWTPVQGCTPEEQHTVVSTFSVLSSAELDRQPATYAVVAQMNEMVVIIWSSRCSTMTFVAV